MEAITPKIRLLDQWEEKIVEPFMVIQLCEVLKASSRNCLSSSRNDWWEWTSSICSRLARPWQHPLAWAQEKGVSWLVYHPTHVPNQFCSWLACFSWSPFWSHHSCPLQHPCITHQWSLMRNRAFQSIWEVIHRWVCLILIEWIYLSMSITAGSGGSIMSSNNFFSWYLDSRNVWWMVLRRILCLLQTWYSPYPNGSVYMSGLIFLSDSAGCI